MKKTLTEIESALTEAVFSLTPSPHEPSEDIEKELITFDREEIDNSKWKVLLTEHLKMAKTLSTLPLARPVDASDLAEAVRMLLFNRSMTGSILNVDCGQSLL